MTDLILRLGVLLAIFASIFIIAQLVLNAVWSRSAHTQAVNKRMKLIKQGSSRDAVVATLRKNTPSNFEHLPPFVAVRLQNLQRTVMAAALPVTGIQVLLLISVAFALLFALLCIGIVTAGFPLGFGTLFLALIVSFCAACLLPVLIIGFIGQRRRKKIEQQFPIALDVFVRALRAGHPVSSAIDLLTKEMEDPIGSEFGLVSDEVTYGAELTDALSDMAERWDLEDIRMFVVSLSVQNETGGSLAEILENLATVIRARASLYMKVRALSSEGRMTGWMLTILPIVAFLGLFSVNPGFYLSVATDGLFIIGAVVLMIMYVLGFIMIQKMIDIKV
ncbi:type II secretion system F family protein [Erythrobacter ani]|uniref:Type II secretion system F family protein n=1 Tax=Erythrobacter ani TaxID=2827235 RepID=A0ABS6SMJ3_9SPHN|nr:type II secretion system F family protein [Erythrobacter ani]MBV7265854.1 type II secretion system F family protein [Erythrobacter ani]